ncbi:MAG: thiamine pyrophosphate-dependent enzyme [Candidatus Acidiferrales bacterium]
MAETYLVAKAVLPYCKGCGHGQVLRALGEALGRLQLPPQEVVIVTDIGCVGLADVQFATPHTVHTTHGRSTAFAAGIALADGTLGAGRLKPIVMIGDGGAMIGLNHLVNAALVNPDLTVLVHNNFFVRNDRRAKFGILAGGLRHFDHARWKRDAASGSGQVTDGRARTVRSAKAGHGSRSRRNDRARHCASGICGNRGAGIVHCLRDALEHDHRSATEKRCRRGGL